MRLLLTEPHPLARDSVSAWLGNQGFDITAASNVDDLRRALATIRPELVLLDESFEGANALALTSWFLRHQPEVGVVVSSWKPTVAAAQQLRTAGASDYLVKPYVSMQRLMAGLKKAEQERQLDPAPFAEAVLVEPDTALRDFLGRVLSASGFKVLGPREAVEQLNKANAPGPKFVLADADVKGTKEFATRVHQKHPECPILLTSVRAAEAQALAQAVGGACLAKPFESLEPLFELLEDLQPR